MPTGRSKKPTKESPDPGLKYHEELLDKGWRIKSGGPKWEQAISRFRSGPLYHKRFEVTAYLDDALRLQRMWETMYYDWIHERDLYPDGLDLREPSRPPESTGSKSR